MDLLKVFRGRVVDVAPDSLIVEVSGTVDKIDGLLEVLRPYGVLEMARTGRIAMTRGGDLLQPPADAEPAAAEGEIHEARGVPARLGAIARAEQAGAACRAPAIDPSRSRVVHAKPQV